MIRAASVLCGLLAAGLLGLAAYWYAIERETPAGASLAVRQSERELGSLPREEAVSLSFRVENVSAQPIQILGLPGG